MKAQISKAVSLLLIATLCLTLENIAQNIIPADKAVAENSLNKLKKGLKKPNKAGAGIRLSVDDLRNIIRMAEERGSEEIYLFVVAMDKSNRSVWGTLNSGTPEDNWEARQGLILKFSSPKTSRIASRGSSTPGFYSPFAMSFGRNAMEWFQLYDFYALGRLCPPPADCSLY